MAAGPRWRPQQGFARVSVGPFCNDQRTPPLPPRQPLKTTAKPGGRRNGKEAQRRGDSDAPWSSRRASIYIEISLTERATPLVTHQVGRPPPCGTLAGAVQPADGGVSKSPRQSPATERAAERRPARRSTQDRTNHSEGLRTWVGGLSDWQTCKPACVPGVEGHACPGVSGPLCRCRHGEHAAQASKQSTNSGKQHGKANRAWRAGGHVHVNPRRLTTPEQHLLIKVRARGRSGRCCRRDEWPLSALLVAASSSLSSPEPRRVLALSCPGAYL